MKAVGYTRISSLRQINNESPETQKSVIKASAEQNGIEIVKWFFDEAVSAKTTDRDELNNLLDFLKANKTKIQYLYVYKMNRISRDVSSYVALQTQLAQLGVAIKSATEQVDATPVGNFMRTIFIANGQLDNEIKGEQTRDTMVSLALQGYWQHNAPFGYKNIKIPNNVGKPRPSLQKTAMAEKVKATLERYSLGDITQAELTDYAFKIGLKGKKGNKIGKDSIKRMLKAPIYAGYISDNLTDYELVEGLHEAIIDRSTFQRNQQLLNRKSRNGEQKKRFNEQFPLKGTLLCSSCKLRLYASSPKTGNGGSSPRYHCARSSCKGKVKSVHANLVHDSFMEVLKEVKPSDGVLRLYKEILIRQSKKQLGNVNNKLRAVRNQLSDLEDKNASILENFISGIITLPEKTTLLSKLDRDKETLEENEEELKSLQNVQGQDIEMAIQFMEHLENQWSVSNIVMKHRFQEMLFPEGLVLDTNSMHFGTSRLSPLYRYSIKKTTPEGAVKDYLVAGGGLEPPTFWL